MTPELIHLLRTYLEAQRRAILQQLHAVEAALATLPPPPKNP